MKTSKSEYNNPATDTDEETETLARFCKALAHPARIRIINHLKQMDRCICGEIVDMLPQAQSTVSRHLQVLKEAGLIRGEIDGPRICYCLDHSMLDRCRRLLAGL